MNRLIRSGEPGRPHSSKQTLQDPQSAGGSQSLRGSQNAASRRDAASPVSYFLPTRYEPNYKYPLVVWLHSDGANHRQIAEVMPHISTQNFVAVGVRGSRACDASGHQYSWLNSPLGAAIAEEAVFAAVDAVSERYSVNPSKIYLAGYREGGTMALRVALRNAAMFDGVISVDGKLPRGGQPFAQLSAARNLAVLSAVALEGTSYPLSEICDDLRLWHAANLRLNMRQYTVDDCMVVEVMRDINAWIMARVTGQQAGGCLPDNETVPVEFSAN